MAKYAFRAASTIVGILILVIIAGPIAGVLTPQLGTQSSVGLGIQLQSIQPQVQQIFSSSSSINGTHHIVIPAFNNWVLPGSVSLYLTIVVHNKTLYQTQPATVQLPPFQSGALDVSMVVSPSLVAQLRGQNVGIGGGMSVSEGQFWTITVSFPQG